MATRRGQALLTFACIAAVLAVCAGLGAIDRCWKASHEVLDVQYPGTLTGPTLREDEALVVAERAVASTKYASATMKPFSRDGAPGTTRPGVEVYMSRHTSDPNEGHFHFFDPAATTGTRELFVKVTKVGDVAEVNVTRGH